jgi:hypothetical protein
VIQDHPTDPRRVLVHTQLEPSCRCVRYLLGRNGIESRIETFPKITGDVCHVSVKRKDSERAHAFVLGFEAGCVMSSDLTWGRDLIEVEAWEMENVEALEGPPDVWCTSYCNQGHHLRTGKPIGHRCYVLPPRALRFEREGKTDEAIEAIRMAQPLREHAGAKVVR